ncbi:MAG: TonB-dependent receptor [Longimicrobiales bacterium]
MAWLNRAFIALVAVLGLAADLSGQNTSVTGGGGAVAGEIRGRLGDVVIPLSRALVEAVAPGIRRVARADDAGRYAFTGLPPGEVTLRVTHVGYESLTLIVMVPDGPPVGVDLELAAVPVALPPVDVLGGSVGNRDGGAERSAVGSGLAEIDLQALDVGPGIGQSGLADVVAALPGNDPSDATDILFLRGSTADLKLVLLDGVPVYTPFHVAGLMKSFEQGVLGAAELHVGGAPARFDGGLTNILELRTRDARRDRLRVSGAVDMLAASTAIEAPLGGRAGVLASLRTLHDLGDTPLVGATPYGYRDALVVASAEPIRGHELRATGFWNEESVRLDGSGSPGSARWSNRVGSIGYHGTFGAARIDLTAGLSTYGADLPLQPSVRPDAPPWEPLPSPLLARAGTDRFRTVAQAAWGEGGKAVRAGISFEHLDERFSARATGSAAGSSMRGSGGVVGGFLDITRPIGEGLSLRAGTRIDHFGNGRALLAPRAAISWEVAPEALVTVAAGRYHQPTRTTDLQVERTLESLAVGGSAFEERLDVASADHVVLGLDQRVGDGVRLGLEGFWKSYRNVPSSGAESVRSSGVDVRIVTAGERTAAWLGYGLSWFWSSVDLSGRTTEFVGRHLLSAGISGPLLGPIQAEARVAYSAGLPYTSIPFKADYAVDAVATSPTINQVQQSRIDEPPRVDAPLDETFLRVDVELHTQLEPTWGGRTWRIRPYLRILNALDRRDALFYTYQPWRSDEVMPLAERPLLPLLGVAFSF